MTRPRVVAVVVAYNRRDLLYETLQALAGQTRKPSAIVVVNNASEDDTSAVVHRVLPDATLIELQENTGGAGGFAVGMAAAMARHDPEWIWVMDDDTVPAEMALEGLLETVEDYPGTDLVAVGSRVVWTDGSEHPMNTPRHNPFARRNERQLAAIVGAKPVRSLSFVSSMYRADRVEQAGFPVADYFLWNDDFEFSSRVLRGKRGLATPASVVVHKTASPVSSFNDPGPRFRFEVRNKIWLFRNSDSFSIAERLGYIAASFINWVQTLLRSQNRQILWSGFREGFREGLGSRPRRNSETLAKASVPEDVLTELDRADK